MKNIALYTISIFLLLSCSSDDSPIEIFDPEFTFEISGAFNKTLSGTGIIYNETTTPVKNYKGENTEITTLLIYAQDGDDVVTFAITLEGGQVGAGNYEVGSDILNFYNAFMNFSGDKGETISYQSDTGTISISSRAFLTSGSVNVTCAGVGGADVITIKGDFHAESVK